MRYLIVNSREKTNCKQSLIQLENVKFDWTFMTVTVVATRTHTQSFAQPSAEWTPSSGPNVAHACVRNTYESVKIGRASGRGKWAHCLLTRIRYYSIFRILFAAQLSGDNDRKFPRFSFRLRWFHNCMSAIRPTLVHTLGIIALPSDHCLDQLNP